VCPDAVRTVDHLQVFAPFLDALVDSAEASGLLSMRLRIFVTRKADNDSDVAVGDAVSSKYKPRHGIVSWTRPSMRSLVLEAIEDAINPCHTCVDCQCGQKTQDGLCPGGDDCCNDVGPSPASKIEEKDDGDEMAVVAEKATCVKPCSHGRESSEKGRSTRPTTASTCCKLSYEDDGNGETKHDHGDVVTASAGEVPESKAVRSGGMSVCACGPRAMLV
jgi:hypothetical protein